MMQKLTKLALVYVGIAAMAGNFQILSPKVQAISPEETLSGPLIIEENSLLPSSPLPELKIARKLNVVVTAYSSNVFETDNEPFITAAGTWVRDGIVANNLLSFGTKIRLPELYDDKIFVVEDRMNSKKGPYHIDIWFPSYWEAKSFGSQLTYIEVLAN